MNKLLSFKNSGLLKWLIIGILLRLILMPITVHPDIRAFDLGGYLISQKGAILSFYDYLSRVSPSNPLLQSYHVDFFIYPPLSYLVPAVFMGILAPFYNFAFNNLFLNTMWLTYGKAELLPTLFLLKFPYLIFDLAIAGFLYLAIKGEKGKTAFKLWMINPLSLYTTFAIGQIDVFPTLLTVAALYFAMKDQKKTSVILLGIGGAFKLVPLLMLPFFALILGEKFLEKGKLFILGLIPYLLTIFPYLLTSPGYRQYAFLAGQTDKMFYMSLPVSGAEYVSVFILGYLSLLFLIFRSFFVKEDLWKFCLGTLLLFFSTTHYHPQWFLWITPFLIWDFLVFGNKHLFFLLVLFACFVGLTLFFESSLHIGLFVPLWPQLEKAPDLSMLLSKYTDIFQIKSIIRTVFAACAIFIAVDLFNKKTEVEKK